MTPTPQQIIEAVAKHCGVSVPAILGETRTTEVWKARAAAAKLMHRIRRMSSPEIAAALKRKSHTSVLRMLGRHDIGTTVGAVELALLGESGQRGMNADSREVIRVLNSNATVRAEVLAYLRAALIGQIVAAHSLAPATP